MSVILQSETLLKHTRSRCPACNASAPAEVWRRSDGKTQTVWLRRRCPEHGPAENCISSDARFYWLAQGDPRNGGCAWSSGEGGYEGTLGRNAAADIGQDPLPIANGKSQMEKLPSPNSQSPIANRQSPIPNPLDR